MDRRIPQRFDMYPLRDRRTLPSQLGPFAKLKLVVTQATCNHIQRLSSIVNVRNLYLLRLVSRELFVTQEIMLQTIDQSLRHVLDFENATVGKIVFQYRNDLVVSLPAVDHP